MKKKNLFIVAACSVLLIAAVVVTVILLGDKECKHAWGEWTVVTEATCKADGSKKHVCSKCNEEEAGVIAKVDHKYGAYTKEQTSCLESVKKSAICEYGCGTKDTIVTDVAPGHKYVVVGHTALGCDSNESTTYKCSACNDTYEEIQAIATGHNVLTWNFVSEELKQGATCEYVQTYAGRCGNCNNEVESEEIIHKHEYTVSVTKEATCQELGIKTYTCVHCGDEEEENYENLNAHQFDGGQLVGNIMTYSCVHNNCSHTKTTIYAKNEVETSVSVEDLGSNELELKNASIALDGDTLGNLLSSDVKISADKIVDSDRNVILDNLTEEQKAQLGDNAIFNFGMEQGGSAVTEFGGKVTVTIEYQLADGEDPNNIAIWYLMDDGTVEAIPASYANGYVTFETTHFSYYSVTRLTAKERCEIYGHSYAEIKVNATCTTDGYTMKICRVCANTLKADIIEAQGHNFTSKTDNPTCTANGKTVHTCETCSYSYTQILKAHGHAWEEIENVAATTEAPGHITFKCSTCNETTEKVLPKLEEKPEVVTDGQIIEKVLKDLANHTYTIKLDNLSFELPISQEGTYTGKVKNAEMYVFYDENKVLNGYFVGTMEANDGIQSYSASAEGYIVDNKIYLTAQNKQNGTINDLIYSVVDLNNMPELDPDSMSMGILVAQSEMLLAYQDMLMNWYNSSFFKVVEKFETTNAEAIKNIKETITTGLFDLTRVTNNYELSLKINQLDEVLTYITTTSVYTLIESIFGVETLEDLDKVLDFTVEKLITQLEKLGLVLDEIIPSIDELIKELLAEQGIESLDQLLAMYFKMEEFNLKEFLADEEIKKISVADLISERTDMTKEDIKALVESTLESFKEVMIIDLLQVYGPGSAQPEQPGIDKPYEVVDEDEEELENEWDYIINLVKLLDEKVSVVITANEEYIVTGAKVKAHLEDSEEFEDYMDLINNMELDSVPSIDLEFSISADLGNLYENKNLENKINEFLSYIYTEEKFDDMINAEYLENDYCDVEIVNENGITKAIVKFVEDYRHMGYMMSYIDDKPIALFSKTEVEEYSIEQIKNSFNVNIQQCCGDWYRYDINFASLEYEELVYAYLIYDDTFGTYTYNENEIITERKEKNEGTTANIDLSYNVKTGKFVNEYVSHKRVEDESLFIEAIGCSGVGRRGFLCAACGTVELEYFTNGHNLYFVEDSIVFVNGTDCEDGVSGTIKCFDCEYEHKFDSVGHYTIGRKYAISELGGTCPGYLVHEMCACGEQSYLNWDNVTCDIDHYGNYDEKYDGCAVTNPQCHFNYYIKETRKQNPEHSCLYDVCFTYYFGIDNVENYELTAKYSLELYIYSTYDHDFEYSEESNENYRCEKYTCHCGSYEKNEYYYNEFGEIIKKIETDYYNHIMNIEKHIWTSELINTAQYGASVDKNILLTTKYEHYYYDSMGGKTEGNISEYEYSFHGRCTKKEYYYSATGELMGEDIYYSCVDHVWDIIYPDKCTGEVYEVYKCTICDYQEIYGKYVKGHEWEYDFESGMYKCADCGLKNINGWDGMIIFQDSTSEYNPNNIVIDYWCEDNLEFIVNVSIVLHNPEDGENDQLVIENVNVVVDEDERVINFNKQDVINSAEEMGYNSSEYDIRITFVPLYIDSDLDYSITLE